MFLTIPSMFLVKLGLLLIFSLLTFALVSNVSAMSFNSNSSTGSDIQNFIDDSGESDTQIIFESGNYADNIMNLNVTRNVTITGNGQVNIISNTGGILFNISANNVKIVNLNISGYTTAIMSNKGELSIISNNITTTGISVNVTGGNLTTISLENNNIRSTSNNAYEGTIHIIANANAHVDISLKGNNINNTGGTLAYGIYFYTTSSNNTLIFENNKITGQRAAINLEGTNRCNNNITLINNNITSISNIGFILQLLSSNNTMKWINNNFTGQSYAISMSAGSSNNTIDILNNNFNGSSYCIYMNSLSNSNNTITINNNNITSRSGMAFVLGVSMSKNDLTVNNNKIVAMGGDSITLNAYQSNNTMIFTNNNISSTNSDGALFDISICNYNNVTIANNNITGRTRGVVLDSYNSTNIALNFNWNNITGNDYAMYINCYHSAYWDFNGLSLENNTLNSTNGVGIYFYLTNATVLNNVHIKSNNIIANRTGISFNINPRFVNMNVNYNRVLAPIGLNYAVVSNDAGSNFDYNWWGNNSPTILGFSLGNWFVVELSANIFKTIVNNTSNQTVTGLNFSYQLVFFDNSTNSTSVVDTNMLPYFITDIKWTLPNGTIVSLLGDARYLHSEIFNLQGLYILKAVADYEDISLNAHLTRSDINLDTNSTINASNTKINNTINITGIVLDEKGNSVLNITITITINGTNYTVTTNSNGEWTLNYTPTTAGSYHITVSWLGNDSYFGFTNNTNFNAMKLITNTTVNVPNNIVVGQTISIFGILTDENGNPLANVNLNILIGGINYTISTDGAGRWNLSYKTNTTGLIDVSANFPGSDSYVSCVNISNFIAVKGKLDSTLNIIESSNGSATFIINLTDINGNSVFNHHIDVFVDSKYVGTVITDDKGMAMISLPHAVVFDNKHEISIVAGNEYYENHINSIDFTRTNNESRENYTDSEDNETDKNNNNIPSKNPVIKASMKKTGLPVLAIILLLLTTIAVFIRRK